MKKSDSEMRRLAIKAVLGYRLDPQTLYEIMPWSWLIDYFTNLGDIVASTRNLVPAYHDDVNIIKTTRIDGNAIQNDKTYWKKMSDARTSYVRKERYPVSGSAISAKFGFLDGRQMSIIASLSILKI
jgi:hypothetical protein